MTLALFFHLGGDIDILGPFLAASAPGAAPLRVLVSENLLASSSRLPVLLAHYAARPDAVLSVEADAAAMRAALRGCSALLTASETSLRPHRLAHALTLLANDTDVETFTLQHGVENVGLTYFDERQGPDVAFAARHVLTWKGTDNMPAIAAGETRAKVIDVGYGPLDDAVYAAARARLPLSRDRPVVGVFENLHWTRFSDAYRRRFLDDLQAIIASFPGIRFLLKPHPEGRWFTERFGGERPRGDNLLLADPADPAWKQLTAPFLMPLLKAVITTPSKVALDAALAGVPAAIASYDSAYDRYEGLTPLSGIGDWSEFLDQALAGSVELQKRSTEFVGRVVSSTNGVANTRTVIDQLSPAGWRTDHLP